LTISCSAQRIVIEYRLSVMCRTWLSKCKAIKYLNI